MPTVTIRLSRRLKKRQRFKVWRDPSGRIMLQSSKSMASFDPVTGDGLASASTTHPTTCEQLMTHPVHCPPDLVADCLRLLQDD